MKRIYLLVKSAYLLLLLVFTPAMIAAQTAALQEKPIAITNVTVIDATGAQARPGMTVLVAGGRIAEIAKAGKINLPKETQVIEGRGKYLIPGLWDMHVHSFYINYLPMYVVNGVTSVRDMGGVPEAINKFRKDIKEGKVVGPRILMAGFIVDGPQPIWPFSVKVANEADGRRAVIEQKQRGVDFIKVYSLLSRESYLAIADEAKKQGMTFAGHVPFAVGAAEASDAGQKSIEHLTGVLAGCSSKEDEMLKEMAEAATRPNARIEVFRILRKHTQTIFETYSEQKAAGLFARFAKNGTYHVPTLTILRAVAFIDESSFTNDPRLKYIPPFLKSTWDPKNDFRLKNRKPEDIEHARKTYEKNLEIVGAMRRAGVRFLAGTDVANPFIFPGFSLHDELSLLVKSGLTPMEALQAATINPAKYFGMTDSLGTIEKGKIADLVLLEANPLEDISNTQKIAAVVMGGKLFNKAYITETLAKIEASTAVK